MSETDTLPVLVLVRDLMMSSKIMAEARSAGVIAKIVRDPALLAETDGKLLIVDLNQPGTIIPAAKWGAQPGRSVVGFVSHVDTETIKQAREAGIGKVLARSGFVQNLRAIVTQI